MSCLGYYFHIDRDSFRTAMPWRSRPKRCDRPWLRRLRRWTILQKNSISLKHVSYIQHLAITKSALLIAQSHEFLRNGWRECRGNAVYFIQERWGCFSCTFLSSCGSSLTDLFFQWFSSGTEFSEYAEGGHYKMSKADKRENIIMVCLSLKRLTTTTTFFPDC